MQMHIEHTSPDDHFNNLFKSAVSQTSFSVFQSFIPFFFASVMKGKEI